MKTAKSLIQRRELIGLIVLKQIMIVFLLASFRSHLAIMSSFFLFSHNNKKNPAILDNGQQYITIPLSMTNAASASASTSSSGSGTANSNNASGLINTGNSSSSIHSNNGIGSGSTGGGGGVGVGSNHKSRTIKVTSRKNANGSRESPPKEVNIKKEIIE